MSHQACTVHDLRCAIERAKPGEHATLIARYGLAQEELVLIVKQKVRNG